MKKPSSASWKPTFQPISEIFKRGKKTKETAVGSGVIVSDDGYVITARFYNIGGLKVKAPVTMAGVTLGRVVDISFDQETYEAVVSMRIDPHYTNIPEDSFAKVYTAGLLGEKYIGLDPGGSDVFLGEGGRLTMTQSSLVLEEIIGQFLFNKAQEAPGG